MAPRRHLTASPGSRLAAATSRASSASSRRSADTALAQGGQRRQRAEQAEAGEIRCAAAAVAGFVTTRATFSSFTRDLEIFGLGVELRDQRVSMACR